MDSKNANGFDPPACSRPSRLRVRLGTILSILSILLCVAATICYASRADAMAAVTIIPVWAWLVPGLVLASFQLRTRSSRSRLIACVAWMIFTAAFAEEPWSLGRSLFPLRPIANSLRPGDERIRVVSLNCAIGNTLAAAEILAYRPDIVLLQESPNRAEVESLARGLFGDEKGVVHGIDASMILNGVIEPTALPSNLRAYFVQARVRLASGPRIEVVSTRLIPAVFRADLWSPDCWREQAANRRKRREQLRVITQYMSRTKIPTIIGGDFNTPQGDAVFRLLKPRLHDAFVEAGRGWGNTITNDFPALRIDQIWVSDSFQAHNVIAKKTKNSDHRVVVCDLILRSE